jgi:hypothetical protein
LDLIYETQILIMDRMNIKLQVFSLENLYRIVACIWPYSVYIFASNNSIMYLSFITDLIKPPDDGESYGTITLALRLNRRKVATIYEVVKCILYNTSHSLVLKL